MPTGKVTKSAVDTLFASDRAQFLWDPELKGFGVKAEPSGAKSYVVQYRLGGRGTKVRRYTIGRHGSPWTPTTARTEAERLLRLIRQGVDVLQAKQEKSRAAHDLAFDSYAERFIESCLKERWRASWKDGKSLLDLHAVPVLRAKPLPEICRADVRAVLDHAKGKIATRRNLFAVLRRLFRWAISEGDLDRSPLEGMEPPPLPASRDRVLADWELRLVFEAAGKEQGPFAPLIRLLILTGQRLEELAGARWDELDRDEAVLRIPAVRAKNKRATDVPLSNAVIEELDGVAGKKWPRKGLVFTTTAKTPVSGFARAKRRLDKHMTEIAADNREERQLGPWRYHDLRRTFATGMQRLGVRFEVTEAILNHVGSARSGVAGVYQRHDWKDEKRVALQAWAAHVRSIVDDREASNVVPFRREARSYPDPRTCAIAGKLARTYAMQLETVAKLRGRGSRQRITVRKYSQHEHKHIHLHQGGDENGNQPHEPRGHRTTEIKAVSEPSQRASLPRPDAPENALPMPSDKREEALPVARRGGRLRRTDR